MVLFWGGAIFLLDQWQTGNMFQVTCSKTVIFAYLVGGASGAQIPLFIFKKNIVLMPYNITMNSQVLYFIRIVVT